MFNTLALCMMASVGVVALAACAIRLRDDEGLTGSTASVAREFNTTTPAELEGCRTITYEAKEIHPECGKIFAEKRRQFFGRSGGSSAHLGPISGSSTSTPPRRERGVVIPPLQGKASD